MGLDIHGESRVRDYQVFIHIYGSLTEPEAGAHFLATALAA